jgi:CheY-like chemotaxis protein
MHILLIDDSSSTRSLLRTLINSGQAVRHEISEAASGEESLQKVESGEIRLPDLIIMDINMGGMSGFDLCREFRQRHGGSELMPYIIIVTANEGVDVINQALDCGANDYMPKPVNVKVLQVRLRVAERLLTQAQTAPPPAPPAPAPVAPAPVAPVPVAPAAPVPTGPVADPRQLRIAEAIDQADAPMALIEAGNIATTYNIVYANAAMTVTTQFNEDELMGRSLADLEAWTPDFCKMVLEYVETGSILSHVPLWSLTRQEVPVYLSFYPIRSGDEQVRHYLVIHHL